MRISDWSSDVCSSDLAHRPLIEIEEVLAFQIDNATGDRQRVLRKQSHDSERGDRLAGAAFPNEADGLAAAYRQGNVVDHRSGGGVAGKGHRSEEHTSELQSLLRN